MIPNEGEAHDDLEVPDLLGTLDENLDGLAALQDLDHTSPDHLALLRIVARAHHRVRAALRGRRDATASADARRDHLPLTADDVVLDPELLRALFDELCGAAQPSHRAPLLNLLSLAEQDAAPLSLLTRAAVFCPDDPALSRLAGEVSIPPQDLITLGRLLAAPFLQVRAAQRGPEQPSGDTGWCPVCGAAAAFALLHGGGRRLACCGLCATTWALPRLRCPWCATDGALTVIRLDDDAPRWLEVCEACHGYLKTVDTRRLPAGHRLLLLTEEAESLHLDLLAQQHGHGPNA